jgi:hypothetical protein
MEPRVPASDSPFASLAHNPSLFADFSSLARLKQMGLREEGTSVLFMTFP